MKYSQIESQDPEIFDLVKKEEQREIWDIELIPSENYASEAVLEASGSIFTNKYAEGYPGKRYYRGNAVVDPLERLTIARAKEVFGATDYYVNVQPYSGSPANLEVYNALLRPGDTILSLELSHGGHLTHGAPANYSGSTYKFVHYPLDPNTEQIDYEVVRKLAEEHKPKIVHCGYTAYPRIIDFQKFHEIAKLVSAICMADIAHIAGLVAGGAHPSPFPFFDVVTTTTHKTLRGPRGAMIFCKEEFKEKIERSVFPGLQGGPHMNNIAGIAVALKEAKGEDFKAYAQQIVKNTKAFAESMLEEGLKLTTGGTDNHLVLLDLRPFGLSRGEYVAIALESAHIITNKSLVPYDEASPFYPSGVRMGTPAMTTRGFKELEFKQTGKFVAKIVKEFATRPLPEDKAQRVKDIREFTEDLSTHALVQEVSAQVKELTKNFPVPGIN